MELSMELVMKLVMESSSQFRKKQEWGINLQLYSTSGALYLTTEPDYARLRWSISMHWRKAHAHLHSELITLSNVKRAYIDWRKLALVIPHITSTCNSATPTYAYL